jgi:hypothetical protein
VSSARSGDRLDESLQAFGPSGGHHDLCADGVEHAGEVLAETGRCAGDDHHLFVEAEAIERAGREGR